MEETSLNQQQPSGFEPELGGVWRQEGVYVDENICVGCHYCAQIASNTFYMEPEHGRARVFNQNGDPEELIEEAIDACPVNCIHRLDYTRLSQMEEKRDSQEIESLAIPFSQRRSQL
ncbi:MAG: ferredoxin [Cyanobacteria bacterium J06621_8]